MVEYLSGGRIQGSSTLTSTPPATSWKELGRTTLSSAGSSIDSGTFTAKDNIMVLGHVIGAAAQPRMTFRFNSDSGSNYADRYSNNGGSDGTNTSASFIYASEADQQQGGFVVMDIINNSAQEKLCVGHSVRTDSTGASAPSRYEYTGKWTNTSNQITSVQLNTHANNWNSGSEIVVLGYDNDEADSGTNFWQELASVTAGGSSTNLSSGTFTAKKYLMFEIYSDGTGGDTNMTFNNDTAGNYAWRRSINDGAEDTGTSVSNLGNIHYVGSSGVAGYTTFFVINKSDKEKIGICEGLHQNSAGAGTAPDRTEAVIKWINTSAQITEIDIDSTSGNFNSKSFIKVWGAD